MKRFLPIILTGVILHLGIAYFLGVNEGKSLQEADARILKDRLFNLKKAFKPENFGKNLAENLWREIGGKSPDDLHVWDAVQKTLSRFSVSGLRIFLMDEEENLLRATRSGSEFPDSIARTLGMKWRRQYKIRSPKWRVKWLMGKPRFLAVWRSATENDFVGDSKNNGKRVGGIVIVFDSFAMRARMPVSWAMRRLRGKGFNIGLLDRLTFRANLGEKNISSGTARLMYSQFLKQPEDFLPFGNNYVVFHPWRENLLFIGMVPPKSPAFPGWMLGLLWIWLSLAFRQIRDPSPGISLKPFMGFSLGISAGIPLLLTIFFWVYFAGNREKTILEENLQEMEQGLIDIDNTFPRTLKGKEAMLQGLMGEMRSQPENVPFFLDRIAKLELLCNSEIFFLVASQGEHLRDYSNIDPSLRRFSNIPEELRIKRLQTMFDEGTIFPRKMVEVAMKIKPERKYLPVLWSYKNSEENARKIKQGVGTVGKMLISRFTQERSKKEGGGGKDTAASMVYGAVIDTQTAEILRLVMSNLGKLVLFGSGRHVVWVFTDIIPDMENRGQYCALISLDIRTLEISFFRKFFSEAPKWEKGDRFFGESSFCNSVFPESVGRRRFWDLEDRLVPPRRLISETRNFAGEKWLVSALACRNMAGFILVCARPWKTVLDRKNLLLWQMAGLAFMMGMILFWIARRLHAGVIAPAYSLMDGIKAMEQKKFDHRIPLTTGDEWDELAGAFNNTLVGMEEMEQAKIVQTRLFPSEPIEAGRSLFLGRSVMTGQIGGDYFDAIPCENGDLAFILGDVTGHGVSAALVVAMAKSAFQIIFKSRTRMPGELLNQMNRLFLTHLQKKKVMTAQAGLITHDGKLIFSNAGHIYPYLLSPERGVEKIAQIGFPLGSSDRRKYSEEVITLPNPSLLVMITDGIIEQPGPDGERLGIERFEEILSQNIHSEPDQLIQAINSHLREYSRGKPWTDDVTIAAVKYRSVS